MEDSHPPGLHRSSSLQAPRPHLFNALSPLQSFSPLAPTSNDTKKPRSHSRNPSFQSSAAGSSVGVSPSSSVAGSLHVGRRSSHSTQGGALQPLTTSNLQRASGPASATAEGDYEEGRSRTPSVTRSLSRRESITALHDLGTSTPAGRDVNVNLNRGGSISRITLVRAPSRKNADGSDVQPESGGGRRRTKSSGYLGQLSPSSVLSSLPSSTSGPVNLDAFMGKDSSALSPSPFAKSPGPADFGLSLPPSASTPTMRTNLLFNQAGSVLGQGLNIHQGGKQLSPEQVLELVEGLKSPCVAPGDKDAITSPKKGSMSRSNSMKDMFGKRGRSGSDVSLASKAGGKAEKDEPLEPLEYVQMNDDVLLPFVDRPQEVEELLGQGGNRDIFEMIMPTFPTQSNAHPDRPDSWRAVPPEDWTWEEFSKHVKLSRAECDDFEWIRMARVAVQARSEAMWERLATCLGCDVDAVEPPAEGEEHLYSHAAALSDVFDDSTIAGSPVTSYNPEDHFGFEGDADGRDMVMIESLEAAEPEEMESKDDDTDDLHQTSPRLNQSNSPLPGAGAMGLMDVAEEEDEQPHDKTGQAGKIKPAQNGAGSGRTSELLGQGSPSHKAVAGSPHHEQLGQSPQKAGDVSRARAKSFVGLHIRTMPSLPSPAPRHRPSSSSFLPGGLERGPGHPLFPTSFSTLSLAPTLPNNNPALKASLSFSYAAENTQGYGHPTRAALQSMMGLAKKTRSGISESAITLASEDF